MSNELAAQLRELKALVEEGLLTQEEFAAEKATLLAARREATPVRGQTAALSGATTAGRPTSPTDSDGSASSSLSGATRLQPSSDLPKRIGSYRLGEPVGAGGMGRVLRARHTDDGWARRQGEVVIKLIHPHIALDSNFRERFLDEAELGRRIRHPSLATVYDVVAEGPWLGTIMAFVEGRSLSELGESEGLALERALSLLVPLAEALDHLHGQGIVHRDLKPANIKVRPDGRPVILDLGIAKDLHADSGHTKTMQTMGTTAWMAPEQADAKRVTAAADRYALGLLAYWLLCGKMPWLDGASEARLLAAKLSGNLQSLIRAKASVPAPISEAVMSMLAVDPRSRPSSCAAFVGLLGGEVSARPSSRPVVPSQAASPETRNLNTASLGQLLLFASWRGDSPDMAGWSREQVLAVLRELEGPRPRWLEWAQEQERIAEEQSREDERARLEKEKEARLKQRRQEEAAKRLAAEREMLDSFVREAMQTTIEVEQMRDKAVADVDHAEAAVECARRASTRALTERVLCRDELRELTRPGWMGLFNASSSGRNAAQRTVLERRLPGLREAEATADKELDQAEKNLKNKRSAWASIERQTQAKLKKLKRDLQANKSKLSEDQIEVLRGSLPEDLASELNSTH